MLLPLVEGPHHAFANAIVPIYNQSHLHSRIASAAVETGDAWRVRLSCRKDAVQLTQNPPSFWARATAASVFS